MAACHSYCIIKLFDSWADFRDCCSPGVRVMTTHTLMYLGATYPFLQLFPGLFDLFSTSFCGHNMGVILMEAVMFGFSGEI